MKKNISKLFAAVLAFISFFAFTSCHDEIFEEISYEVALEEHGIQGAGFSFVRYKQAICFANGRIYGKANIPSSTSGKQNKQWERLSRPGEMDAVSPIIASDSEYMYTLSITWKENSDGENVVDQAVLYATDSDPLGGVLSWRIVDTSAITGGNYDYGRIKVIFDNQAFEITDSTNGTCDLSERVAYAKIFNASSATYEIYKLNGTSQPTLVDINSTNTLPGSFKMKILSAVNFKGKDYFSAFYALSANKDFIFAAPTTTDDDYNVSGSNFIAYYDENLSFKGICYPGKGTILSTAIASDYILIGTATGLARVPFVNSVPQSTTIDFSNNGDTIVNENIFKVFILDPSKKESSPSIYGTDEYATNTIEGSIASSSDQFNNMGLYAYYPARNEWNRDGTGNSASNGN